LVLGFHNVINLSAQGQNKSGLAYMQKFEASAKSYSTFEVIFNQKDQSHAVFLVFQMHSFYFNMTLSMQKNLSRSSHQNGTNLGFVLRPSGSSQLLHLWNDNFDDVQCMVAVVVYNNSAPIPGGCDESNATKARLNLEETANFIVLQTSPAQLSNEMMNRKKAKCGDEGTREMEYYTFYVYLEQLDFQHDAYFKGIESLLFDDSIKNGYQVRL
jgi:hypothetical protein